MCHNLIGRVTCVLVYKRYKPKQPFKKQDVILSSFIRPITMLALGLCTCISKTLSHNL